MENKKGTNIVIILAIMIVIIFVVILFGSSDSNDSNDGKCDICGKSVYKKLNGEEFCKEHFGDAAKWYLEKDSK